MTEHLSEKQFGDYRQRQLQAADLLNLSKHLDQCEVCRRRGSEIGGDEMFLATSFEILVDDQTGESHLTERQLSDYVDSLTGEEHQTLVDHLTTCDLCQLAVDDLRHFRDTVTLTLDRDYQPVITHSFWNRALAFLPGAFRESPLPVFASVLGILLLAGGGWFVWRSQHQQKNQADLAALPTPLVTPVLSPEPTPQPAQSESVVVAQLIDGGRELKLDQNGKLSGADDLPADYRNLLIRAMSNKPLERASELRGLTRPPSALMGSENSEKSLTVLEPTGIVIMTSQPAFRWTTLKGATSYVVEVYDEQFKVVATSPQLVSTKWRPSQPFTRGKVYSWQVKATREGEEITSPQPPAPQAKFRVLDQARFNELRNLKGAYGSSHLALGWLYANTGLLQESEQEFRILQRNNPNSEVARSLLRQVQALRRR